MHSAQATENPESGSRISTVEILTVPTTLNNILQHILNFLDAEGFQKLLQMQLISVAQYNIRKHLLCLLEVNIFLLQVIENICDSLQC